MASSGLEARSSDGYSVVLNNAAVDQDPPEETPDLHPEWMPLRNMYDPHRI